MVTTSGAERAMSAAATAAHPLFKQTPACCAHERGATGARDRPPATPAATAHPWDAKALLGSSGGCVAARMGKGGRRGAASRTAHLRIMEASSPYSPSTAVLRRSRTHAQARRERPCAPALVSNPTFSFTRIRLSSVSGRRPPSAHAPMPSMGADEITGRPRVRRCHPYVATNTSAGPARDPSLGKGRGRKVGDA